MTAPPESQRRRAVIMLVLANLCWGLSFPVIKALTTMNRVYFPGSGSWFVTAEAAAPRFLLASLVMWIVAGRGHARATRSEVVQGIVIGAFAAAGTMFQTDGMQFTDASTSAFLTQFSAILVPAWIALRNRRNPGAVVWSCCALVLLGVGVLGHFDWRHLRFGRGEWESLLCSFFFTGQILWIARKGFTANRPGPVTQVMFLFQAAVFTALAVATAPHPEALARPWTSPAWVALTCTLAVVCTYGAFSLMTRWQPLVSATEAGLVYCIEPVFASVFALFLPGILSAAAGIDYRNERATWTLLVGGGLVILANVLVQTRQDPRA